MMGHPAFELDWNLVRSFAAVARAGSLAGGARSLGITHPTVARHIQQLEQALGMTLFSRTAQGLVLNHAGERLDQAARAMHQSALAFQATSDTVRDQPLPRIRLAVDETLAELLPDVMLSELRDCARNALTVDMVVTNDVLNLLERDADIALRNVRPQQQELLCRKVGRLQIGVFAHRDYAAEHGMLTRASLAQHRFVDGLTRTPLMDGATARGLAIQDSQIVLRSDSVPCQRAAVRAGLGIAVFPVWMAGSEPDWESVYNDGEVMDLDVWLVGRPEVRVSAHLLGMFTRLGERLAERLV